MIRGVLRIAILVAIGIAIVASVTAQEPASRAAVPSTDKDKIVVTGCVQRAAQLPTGTSGTVGAVGDVDSSKFILTKATAADSKALPASQTYKLDADDSLLTTHVGHQVEITGMRDSAKATPGAASDPAPPAASGSKLKVTSVKMIAAACAE
jgi:hypothetical protein